MKRSLMLMALIVAFAVLFAACKKKATTDTKPATATEEPEKKAEPAKAEEPEKKAEPAKAEEPAKKAKPAAKAEEPAKAEEGGGDAEKNCGAMYDMMQQLRDAMIAKFGKGKKPDKPFPPKEKFVAACKLLPPPAVRCMNPQVAMKEAAKCKEVMAKVDKAQIKKIQAMLK